jgi:gliding motility-associated-like protein
MQDKISRKIVILVSFSLFCFVQLKAQIGVTNTAPNNNPTYLINNVLVGSGVAVSNISFTGSNQQIGAFTSGNSIGMASGIVMSSGHVTDADLGGSPNSPNTPASGGVCNNTANTICNDLYTVANSVPPLINQWFSVSSINDAAVLEFDFTPESDTIRFNYCFGSEEYLAWVNSSYNDVFGFFISGPGITGSYSSPVGFPNGSINIATVPNSSPSLPITISSIHPGMYGQYYNTGNITISYNGYTDVFTAEAIVQACETYHIRLAIADGSDDYLDSGVFLEANSFSSPTVAMGTFGVTIGVDTLSIPCNGTLDLEAQLSGGYNILWNTGASSNIITVGAGTYFFSATSSSGSCVLYSDTVTIVEETLFSTSFTSVDVSCNSLLDGSIDISISGGILPYTYSWIDSTSGAIYSTEDLTNIGAGDYWCTITDANGCSALPFQVVITAPNAIFTNSTLTDITCFGANDGGIVLNAIGGNLPLSINWTGPNGFSSTSDSLFSLAAGTYSAIITDANNCSLSPLPFVLTEPLQFSASYIASDISCFGLNNGSIDLSIQGGVSPYSVTWQGPNGFLSYTEDISNLGPGLYTLNVIDANLCLMGSAIQVVISEPDDITYSTSLTNVSCYGEQDGAIDLVLNGGVGFITTSWVYPNGVQINTEDLNGLSSGSYTFTIIDANGCSPSILPMPVFITEPLEILILATIQDEQCYGDGNGLIDLTVTNANGPFNYNWMGPLSFSSTLADIAGLNAGSYQVTVTDNSNLCAKDTSFVISLGSQIQIQSATSDVSCFNGADGSINLTPQGLLNPIYAWSNGDITEDILNLSAGNYSVLVNDDANCPSYFSFVINQPDILELTSNVTEVSCPGGNNGNIDVVISGGTFPYTYIWSNGNTTPINQSLGEGIYSLSVYDINNCIVQASFQLIAEDFHVDATITDPQCFGSFDGLVDIEVIGGDYPFTYIWSNGQTSQDVINLNAGLYSLSITDALNCTIDTLIFVNQPSVINAITTTSDVICFGSNTGSVGITPIGGNPPYIVDWGSVDTSALYAGTYSYQISDFTGCIYNNTFSILPGDSIGVSYVKTDVQCYGESTGVIDIQISPGSGMAPYQYSWTGPNSFSSFFEDVSNLAAGIYVFQITDANSCTKEVHIVVGEPTISLNQIITTNTSDYTGSHIACNGDNSGWINLDINGGYIPFTYIWNTGDITDSISNLYAGIYNVTVTDGLGCSIDYSFNLSEPLTVMSGSISATTDYNNYEVRCYGNKDGAIEAIVTGGAGNYTYQWNNGYNSDSIFNLSAGYYEVAVYDNNGCLWMDSIILNQPDSLTLIISSSNDTCEREIGYTEVFLSGGVPVYTYLWSSGQTTSAVYDLVEGIYEIVVIDENLCEISDVSVIENLPSPRIDFKRLPEHKRFYDQIDNPFIFVDVSDTYWQNIVDWQWDFGDNTFGEDSIVFHSYEVAGEYTVLLAIETEYNCWDTISKKIVIDEYEIFIPNTFTPFTGDMMNDEFKAYGYGIENYIMKIYNRWGEILFESNDINRGWNGTTRDGKEIAPIGVYLYFIEVENIYGEIFIYQDALKIMR